MEECSTLRGEDGRFMSADNMKRDSIIANIIQEEVDLFLERVKSRLNEVDFSRMNGREKDEVLQAKEDIIQAVGSHFGLSTAKSCIRFTRKRSAWNAFSHENYSDTKNKLIDEGVLNTNLRTLEL